jgi:penicillin-binding protein 1A
VVLSRRGDSGQIGFADGTTGPLYGMPQAMKPGDVITVAPNGNAWAVRTVPEVSGGMVVEDPQSGRVLAMQGGFDARLGCSTALRRHSASPAPRSSLSSMPLASITG